MNIKQIVDKIPKEADLNPDEYTVADRIADVNEKYLFLIEHGIQIGSIEPLSDGEPSSEEFSITDDNSQTLDRTIMDAPIVRVDFMPTGASRYMRVDRDPNRMINGWCGCGLKFFANEKQIFIERGRAGTIRVTYARCNITLFTEADYNDDYPPTPDWLPETFHPLLWLEPATFQAENYKKDRAPALRNRLTRLENLFYNHYNRNAVQDSRFETRERGNCGGDNYR